MDHPSGKFGITPLMAGVGSWNTRIVEFLMERGVDPEVKDVYGFTAQQKAEMKNLRTITRLLQSYEGKDREKVKA